MLAALRHCRRLIHVGYILGKHRVLVPDPAAAELAPGVRRLLILVQGLTPRAKSGGQNVRDQARNKKPTARRYGQRLADALTELGPSYIKLGQLLATRPDIVGDQMAGDLQHLQDRLPPFAVQTAWNALAQEFGDTVDELFVHLGFPIAAASIAQVHKATIHPDKTEARGFAAVKVLRPRIESRMRKDLQSFLWVARRLERLGPEIKRLEPVKLVETLRATTEAELDLRLEAAAASEFAERDRGRQLLRIPAVAWQHTSRRVLTTEWIEGIPLADLERLEAAGCDRKALARQLLEAFLIHALFDGYFHADLHQGNLLVDEEGRLTVLDFGIMGRLDKQTRLFLAEILFGFLTRDYTLLADVHFEAGYVPAHQSRAAFAQALRSIGEPVFRKQAKEISMARLLEQLFETTRLFEMHMQPQLILLQKTMVAAEGVARTLDPEINFWETAEPIVQSWMEQSIGPEALVEDLTLSARRAALALRHLPDHMASVATLNSIITPDGLKLHPETAAAIANGHNGGPRRWPWVFALAIVGVLLLLGGG